MFNHLKGQKVIVFSNLMISDFRKSVTCWEVPRFPKFVPLIEQRVIGDGYGALSG
jgi:hypothetical protein